jgi:hypothetical protein
MMPALNPPNSLVVDSEKLLNYLSTKDDAQWLIDFVQTHKENGFVTVTQEQLIEAGVL